MVKDNGVSDAQLAVDKNSCTIEDIELCEKGVHSIWSVDEQGSAMDHIEDWSMEAYYSYYNCTGCGESWDIAAENKDPEEVWARVKEHLNV